MSRYYARLKFSDHKEFEVETTSEETLRKLIDDITEKVIPIHSNEITSKKLSS